jgi:mRNA-degrading endonuclease toxin of MazEF toxin-antitoxin module
MLITPQMCLRLDQLKIFGLCWLVQFMPKDGKQKKTRLNFVVEPKEAKKKIDVSVVQTMLRGVRTKLFKIADNGPLAVVSKRVLNIILFV